MRPILVSILAILIILVGVFFLIIGILGLLLSLFAYMAFESFRSLVPIALVASLIFFVVGLILTIAGVGLWKLRMWAWALAVIVLVFALIGQITGFSWFSFLIQIGLLIYLLAVREHFY